MKLGKGRMRLTEDPVGKSIMSMMWPMMIGMVSILSYNIVDTFFIGQLGTMQLAAVSFTFPVAFIVGAIAIGLGTGTSSVTSRLFGSRELDQIQRITTHAALLALLIGGCVLILGLNTIHPLFMLLGANETTLPLIEQYMSIYYFASFFLLVPMIGNSVLRASGDVKTPAYLMMAGALLNVVLDPIFIFGWGPVPRMEIEGAALATVLANAITGSISIGVIYFRDHLIRWKSADVALLMDSWRRILHVGIPSLASSLVAPITTAFITWQVSQFGQEAVAGFGVAARVEAVALMTLMALSAAITPFTGQNFGAKFYGRVSSGMGYAYRWGMIYGLAVAAILFIAAPDIASWFTQDAVARATSEMHMQLVPWTYGFLGMSMVSVSAFNAVGKPGPGMLVSMSRTIGVYAPLAFVLAYFLELRGVFLAAFCANIISGLLGYYWFRYAMQNYVVPVTAASTK
jgi:putative MATE family efflux protein